MRHTCPAPALSCPASWPCGHTIEGVWDGQLGVGGQLGVHLHEFTVLWRDIASELIHDLRVVHSLELEVLGGGPLLQAAFLEHRPLDISRQGVRITHHLLLTGELVGVGRDLADNRGRVVATGELELDLELDTLDNAGLHFLNLVSLGSLSTRNVNLAEFQLLFELVLAKLEYF